ncbi:adenylate isopentenyltransferase-like [Impatiens glandulifera]|uniref:adenylate isopentenyltransferase-like n=1 Tax=Impatiens glandulifera TaxID=253017 RepID=UPI001FB1A103|nr:adenylate isopentenyltransferase-like [Impatiens glandulifera]
MYALNSNNLSIYLFLLMTLLLLLLSFSFLSRRGSYLHHKSSHHHHHQKIFFLLSTPSPNLPLVAAAAAAAIMPHQYFMNRRRYSSSSQKPKIVVIMGPTGSGKSRLSMDLATRYFPSSEIINSDKIQVYRGLDITTNKIPLHQQLAVTHHLLGDIHPRRRPEFTPSDFRAAAASAISLITDRKNLPLVVGGSNSFIYALIADNHNHNIDDDDDDDISNDKVVVVGQRYDCCFIRIDVSFPVLNRYLVERVDEMMGCGMLEELEEFFKSEEGLSPVVGGLRKAIGVAELEEYFRGGVEEKSDRPALLLEKAIGNIKRNTCELARRQVEKIRRLTNGAGWEMHKLDGTEAMRAAIAAGQGRLSAEEATEIWETQLLHPSVKIVKHFLLDE